MPFKKRTAGGRGVIRAETGRRQFLSARHIDCGDTSLAAKWAGKGLLVGVGIDQSTPQSPLRTMLYKQAF